MIFAFIWYKCAKMSILKEYIPPILYLKDQKVLGKPSKEKTGNIFVFYQYWGEEYPPTNIFPVFSWRKNIYSLKMIYML